MTNHTNRVANINIFVSSVKTEFSDERQKIREFINNDPLLKHFFQVYLFEDFPVVDYRPSVYLDKVNQCTIYLGIFGSNYRSEDLEGAFPAISPTEREFDRATEQSKYRIIFVHKTKNSIRTTNMAALVQKAERQLVRRYFTDISDLKTEVYSALVQYLYNVGLLQNQPFNESASEGNHSI